MSFSNNCKSERIPGPIRGNALSGICEKTCLQAEKVFDACMSQTTMTDLQLTLTDVTPTDLTAPYKFVSAKSTSTDAQITVHRRERQHRHRYRDRHRSERRDPSRVRAQRYTVFRAGDRRFFCCERYLYRRQSVYGHRLRYRDTQNHDAGRHSRAELRILLYPAVQRVYRAGLRRRFRPSDLSAGVRRRLQMQFPAERLTNPRALRRRVRFNRASFITTFAVCAPRIFFYFLLFK